MFAFLLATLLEHRASSDDEASWNNPKTLLTTDRRPPPDLANQQHDHTRVGETVASDLGLSGCFPRVLVCHYVTSQRQNVTITETKFHMQMKTC